MGKTLDLQTSHEFRNVYFQNAQNMALNPEEILVYLSKNLEKAG